MDETVHPSWTPEAIALLDRACERHGGRERWRGIGRIVLVPESLSGALPRLKGLGRTFRLPEAFDVRPHDCTTIFEGYPDSAHTGIFERGAVRIATRAERRIVVSSEDHRATFRGLAKYRSWSPLDALYFFGYALWHYHTLPFTLGAGRLIALRTVETKNGRRDALEVELPADMPTHCRHQTFHFDETGCLTRHDYTAEVVGSLARGAHFWKDYRSVEGFPVAMERHVLPRFGGVILPVSVLHARFAEARIEMNAGRASRDPSVE